MGAPIHDDIALPALTLTEIVENRDSTWCLHDSAEAIHVRATKFGQSADQAAYAQMSVLRTIKAIDIPAGRVVAGRKFCASRRRYWVVSAAVASEIFDSARFGRLQQ